MSANSKKSPPKLAEGQVWRIDNAHLHIVEFGRRMIHFRLTRPTGEKALATQMIGIEALAVYLRATEVTLVN